MSGEGGDGIGHHEPRAAGVFMPGLAQAPLEDPDVQALMRQKTLTLGQTDSTECLGSVGLLSHLVRPSRPWQGWPAPLSQT